jgi:hypothetical protein
VLTTINCINAHSGQTVLPPPPAGEHPYYDVNGDPATRNDRRPDSDSGKRAEQPP